MKAVRIHDYGRAEVLRYEDAPVPPLADDELLIRVVAAGVNPVDWKIREGRLKDFVLHRMPLVLGWDVSGVVEATGAKATRFRPGDAVYARPDIARDGCYAEYVAVRESEVAAKPATISHVEAASLPLAGITAWQSVIAVGGVEAGQRVLVHAASGGVGSLAVQLAKWRGAHVVATTSGANRLLVESLGADEVVDYRSVAFKDVVRDIDLVFDTLGARVQEDSWRVLRPGGMLVSIVQPPDPARAQAHGLRCAYVFIEPDAAVLERLAGLVEAGRLRPLVGAEFALRHAAQAHGLSESGRARGKIVLYVGQP